MRQPPSLAFLGITDPVLGDWIKARVTPHPLATYNQPAPVGNAMSAALPHVYLHCTAGPTTPLFATFAAKARASGLEVHELATGHMVMLTIPNELAELLIIVAGQASG